MIRIAQPRYGIEAAVRARLIELSADGTIGHLRLPTRSRSGLAIAAPHPVFGLSLQAVLERRDFESAFMLAWRYFVVSDGKVVAVAELAATGRDDVDTHVSLRTGRIIALAAEALSSSEAVVSENAQDCVLGVLTVPAMRVEAFWFRETSQPHERDWFVPIAGLADASPDQPVRSPEFMWLLYSAHEKSAHISM